MKCAECGREEDPQKRKVVAEDRMQSRITHHECRKSHAWHVLYAGRELHRYACDCGKAR